MKVLFVLDNLSSNCGANISAVIKLLPFLRKKHKVYGIANTGNAAIDESKRSLFDGVEGIVYGLSGGLFADDPEWNELSASAKLWKLMRRPKKLLAYAWCKLKYKNRLKSSIEHFCADHGIDVVIGVTEPYTIAEAVAGSNISAKKMLIQMDPYTFNYRRAKKDIDKRRKKELSVIGAMDKMLILDFVYHDMLKTGLIEDDPKFISFQYPALLAETEGSDEGLKQNRTAQDGTIRCAFVGRFYPDIRNPHFLLELFSRLPENYELDIVGGGVEDVVSKYAQRLGSRLHCHGWVSSERASALMECSDVLINLDNTITNQMPSKLIEYFYTGKPIINICFSDACPSLAYVERYSNCISVKVRGIDADMLADITNFVSKSHHTRIERAEVLRAFEKATDKYNAQLLDETLQSVR